MRQAFTFLHRWIGLAIAAFLFLSGLTGAVISWDHELDDLLERASSRGGRQSGPAIASLELARAGRSARSARARHLSCRMTAEPGESLSFSVQPRDRSRDRPRSSNSATTRSSSIRRPARNWAGANGARPGRSRRENLRLVPLQAALHACTSRRFWGIDRWGVWLLGIVAAHLDDRLLRRLLSDAAGAPPLRAGPAPAATRELGKRGCWARWTPAWKIKTSRQRLPDQFRHPPRLRPVDLGAAVHRRLHGVLAQSLSRGLLSADVDWSRT